MYLKEKIKDLLPAPVFRLAKKIWVYFFMNPNSLIMKIWLVNFRQPEFVPICFNGYSFDILIDPKNGRVDNFIFINRVWDEMISDVLLDNLYPGGTFIDVGANIGYFSLLASRLVGGNGTVQAFEPVKQLSTQFSTSIRKNNFDNIYLHRYACGSETREMDIMVNKQNVGGSSLIEAKNPLGSIHERIQIRKMDDMLKNIQHIDMIKIDVEGYEFEVLKGAENLIKKHKPKIIFEFNPVIYEASLTGSSLQLLKFLTEHHYVIQTLRGELLFEKDFPKLIERLKRSNRQIDLFCK
ncbi:MAG: Methyltransferase FkbM family [Parcubacteria group bacterium GW2011_GWC1_38_6]|uniref:Methyltransferase FkbM domain-containing protein n=1 Tax=Candidatus Zambryskibacteria bacterium RIFCSPHIGHO2_01_FULL_46_25 TaxID=1802738 RepID=A0A1G2T137_9BACT|nr:MAG: Methyltransferase FkbM family [Parcubacteria group bacterium GW2011_GWC1_38_6]OHA90539.1 MAG: hypothetical protein A2838_01005 [Candidatus Zambryskibacteria bacterium RIFCSPHIGHO2_01_FULL_46_25]